MKKEDVLLFINKNGELNAEKMKSIDFNAEQMYCFYHELDISIQEFKFLSFVKGYDYKRFKNKEKSISSAADIIKYENLIIDSMGRVNGNLINHLNYSGEKVFHILKGGIKLCPGCGCKCTFAGFIKGYKKNCGRNSCVAVYSNIVEKGRKSKEGNYKPEWNHWYNKTPEEKEETLRIRAIRTRATRELRGSYMKLEDKEPYQVYFDASSFKHGFKTNSESQNQLLEEHGVYNRISNPTGCVRDHLLSRRYGFDNNIDPAIIAHPANCEIVLHVENVRRAWQTSDNQITLEELLERIENWDNN